MSDNLRVLAKWVEAAVSDLNRRTASSGSSARLLAGSMGGPRARGAVSKSCEGPSPKASAIVREVSADSHDGLICARRRLIAERPVRIRAWHGKCNRGDGRNLRLEEDCSHEAFVLRAQKRYRRWRRHRKQKPNRSTMIQRYAA